MSERRPDLRIDIIAPSAYDDRGDLKQYWMVLMRPPVFAVLDGLADQAANDFGLNISIAHHNERTKRGEDYLGSIIRARSLADENVVLITAKSFEVPRAIDIAKKLKEAGMQVVLGGPGITLADCRVYDYLVQEGIPFNVGEGENTVSQIIQDAVDHQLRPAYWQKGYVDMRQAPLPALPRKSEYGQMIQGFAAIDIGQGCPFKCSYCSARELRGKRMTVDRSRNVSSSMEWIREAHDRGFSVMIIDDNFRRAHTYPESKKNLILLNEELRKKGEELDLFGQLDLRKDIIDEAKDLAAMGFKHVFVGMESDDPLVLAASAKEQNKPELYPAIVNAFHRNGIVVSTGRMIGFPPQTPASIHAETGRFVKLVDLMHNYAVVPLPGTDDYLEAVKAGQLTTWDLNSYDGTHFIRNWFDEMTLEDAAEAYRRSFFDAFPVNRIFSNLRLRQVKDNTKRYLYGRGLAELGDRFYDHPFHIMMDGIPHIPLPGSRVRRPADGFTGFEVTPEDIGKEEKDRYLSRVAWSP